jgi:hypothetical protein
MAAGGDEGIWITVASKLFRTLEMPEPISLPIFVAFCVKVRVRVRERRSVP